MGLETELIGGLRLVAKSWTLRLDYLGPYPALTGLLYLSSWAFHLNLISLCLDKDNNNVKALRKCLVSSTVCLLLFSSLLFFFLLLICYNKQIPLNAFRCFKEQGNKEVQGYLGGILTAAYKLLCNRPLPVLHFVLCGFSSCCSSIPVTQSSHFRLPNFCSPFRSQVRVTSSGARPVDKARSPDSALLLNNLYSSCSYLFLWVIV